MVYQLCDGKNSISDIRSSIAEKLNQPVNNDWIWLALAGLKKDKLLEESESFEIDFNGLTRRQVIKQVGLASMIALPLVSSVIAPTAANAQSSCQAPGTIFPDLCSINPSTCNLNPNVFRCCSGMATSVSQPCPVLTTLQFACACA